MLLTLLVVAAVLLGALGYVACGLSAVVTHGRWLTLGDQSLVIVIARLVRRPWAPDGAFPPAAHGVLGPTPLTLCLWALLLAGVAAALVWSAVRLWHLGVGRQRPGFATPAEVRRNMSEVALRRRSRFLYEPRRLRRIAANDLGVYIGRDAASGTALWAAAEDSWVIVGPTRSGKTMRVLVRTILDAPGPVVTTSIRLDTLTLTAPARAKVGPVSVFDPLGTTGWPVTMHWSPIRGCQDPLVARRRANGFAAATGIDTSHGDGAYWVRAAARVIRAYLHAAALGTATLD
ncbi:MAG TPA: type IV secretory system conjugative DNA transfer family protein, partial [Acidimicrobiales bacterium]